MSPKRSLDLVCGSKGEQDLWVRILRRLPVCAIVHDPDKDADEYRYPEEKDKGAEKAAGAGSSSSVGARLHAQATRSHA